MNQTDVVVVTSPAPDGRRDDWLRADSTIIAYDLPGKRVVGTAEQSVLLNAVDEKWFFKETSLHLRM